MLPLFLLIHIFVGSTIAGSAVVVALTMGYDRLTPILNAAAARRAAVRGKSHFGVETESLLRA